MRESVHHSTFNIERPMRGGFERLSFGVECWALNVLFLVLAIQVTAETTDSKLPPPASQPVNFVTDIRPILEKNCFRCHGPERPKSGYRLDNRDSALMGGHQNTNDIVPGDSSNSALILYVARLDPDMAMPPEGKGEPLTTEQVALLRAWIDQGAPWDGETVFRATLSLAPAVGFATVHGNEGKFREHWWQRDGWRGGLESFEMTEAFSPEAKLTVSGHAMTDDYLVTMLVERKGLGFVRSGFEQFRKYDSDTGGYFPPFSTPVTNLNRHLHLDLGRAWFDFGLTLPDWPRIVLGYEYQYRTGEKATLQWGPVSEGGETRNIFPAAKNTDERTHVLKLDLDYERNGWVFADSFRGEWTDLRTSRENVSRLMLDVPDSMAVDKVREGWRSFQGANTIRLDRQFKDWFYVSAGYLYSRLTADADFTLDTFNPSGKDLFPPVVQSIEWRGQGIVLERESHVGNFNTLLGPWEGATLTLAAQGEWTRQNGTMDGYDQSVFTPVFSGPPFNFNDLATNRAVADIDRVVVDESATLRFTRLPFTTLFAETRLQQECIGHHEDVEGHHTFLRNTDATSCARDARAGFDTSPRAWIKFGSQYRWYDKSTTYDDGFADGDPADIFGYPTFIKSRDLTTQEIKTRLTLRPSRWLKTTLTHRLLATDYHTATEPLTDSAPGDLSPGGGVFAGNYDAQIFSLNLTLTPCRRLYCFATVSCQDIRSVAMHDNSAAVTPYRGDLWTLVGHGRYVLTDKTDLTAGYTFSTADFRQDNFASGLPVGMRYDLYGMQVGLLSRCTKNLTTKLQYGFYHYNEPSSGGANDYTAHTFFASLNLRLP